MSSQQVHGLSGRSYQSEEDRSSALPRPRVPTKSVFVAVDAPLTGPKNDVAVGVVARLG
jgi:hypothetical protein